MHCINYGPAIQMNTKVSEENTPKNITKEFDIHAN